MMGLMMKDLLNLRQYGKQMALVYGFYIVCSMMGMWDISFFVALAIMIGGTTFLSTLTYDDMAKWDTYALTMPIGRRDLVNSKYLLLVGSMAVNTVLSLAIAAVLQTIQGNLHFLELAATAVSVFIVGLTGFCLTLFLAFKLGAEKARIFLMAIFLIPTFGIFMVAKIAKAGGAKFDLAALEANLPVILAAGAVVLLVVGFVSYRLAVKVVEAKEF